MLEITFKQLLFMFEPNLHKLKPKKGYFEFCPDQSIISPTIAKLDSMFGF